MVSVEGITGCVFLMMNQARKAPGRQIADGIHEEYQHISALTFAAGDLLTIEVFTNSTSQEERGNLNEYESVHFDVPAANCRSQSRHQMRYLVERRGH
eukprot:g34079.t1